MNVAVVAVAGGHIGVGVVVAGTVLDLCGLAFIVAFGLKSNKSPVRILTP